jgi:hypothetical protein
LHKEYFGVIWCFGVLVAKKRNEMKKTILIILVLAAVVGGCNKTKQTINKLFGTYEVSQYTVNGIDSLNLFKDSLSSKCYFYFDESALYYMMTFEGYNNFGNYRIVACSWILQNNNNTIKVDLTNGHIGTGPFGVYRTPEFEILDLDRKGLKMKTTYNSKEYVVDLEKK